MRMSGRGSHFELHIGARFVSRWETRTLQALFALRWVSGLGAHDTTVRMILKVSQYRRSLLMHMEQDLLNRVANLHGAWFVWIGMHFCFPVHALD